MKFLSLLQALSDIKAHAEAFREALRFARLNPHNGAGLANAAAILDSSGMNTMAEQYLRFAIERDPTNPLALTHLGVCLIRKGQHVEAEQVLRQTTVVAPQHGEGWRNHGSVLHLMGLNKQAEVSLREATRVNPRDEVAFNNLGAAMIALNRPRDAAAAFQEALKVNPHAISSLVNMDHAFRQYCWWWRRSVIAHTLLSITSRQMQAGLDLSLQTYPALTYQLPSKTLLAISSYRAKMLLYRVGGRLGDPNRCGTPTQSFDKLRLGMVSSDYGEHPVAYALNEVVCQRNTHRIEHHLYALTNSGYNAERSPLRQKFRRCADSFTDMTHMDFEASAGWKTSILSHFRFLVFQIFVLKTLTTSSLTFRLT